MAILKNVELFYPRLDPKKPNSKFNKEQPTWEVQIRTKDKKQAAEWKALNISVKPDEDSDGKIFYKATLKKKSKKKDKSSGELVANEPVQVVSGSLEKIDPSKIGNGSIANVRLFQYEYEMAGKKGIASMLMAVQITKLNEYIPKPREDDFAMVDMEVVKVADNQVVDEDQFSSSDELEDDLSF